jgi:hypothetical protein
MPSYGKLFLPFRLKLLLVILAAAAAGIYLSYAGLKSALRPYSEEEAGTRLLARLDLAAAALETETSAGLERAELTAARTGLRGMLDRRARGAALPSDSAGMQKKLKEAAADSPAIVSLDLLDRTGLVIASLDSRKIGKDLSGGENFRRGLRSRYLGAARIADGDISYEIAVPAPKSADGSGGSPAGVLLCRLKASGQLRQALGVLRAAGFTTAIARRNGEKLVIAGPGAPPREVEARSPEAAPFLGFMSGSESFASIVNPASDGLIYAGRVIPGTDWIAAAGMPRSAVPAPSAGLLERARLAALLAFILVAAAAVFAVSLLTGPLGEAGRQAGELMEICGTPAADKDRLCEPATIAAALETASAMLKKKSFRGAELETETEKLREEEEDLKSQNDELEKLNKYLMEREIKISELKKEISELREKVGGGVPD